LKQIVFSDEAKSDVRAIPQQTAMSILAAIHRLAEGKAGGVKMLSAYDSLKQQRKFACKL
jgi:hypothetical protein